MKYYFVFHRHFKFSIAANVDNELAKDYTGFDDWVYWGDSEFVFVTQSLEKAEAALLEKIAESNKSICSALAKLNNLKQELNHD